MVIETFDGQLLTNIGDKLYLMEVTNSNMNWYQREFDAPGEST